MVYFSCGTEEYYYCNEYFAEIYSLPAKLELFPLHKIAILGLLQSGASPL